MATLRREDDLMSIEKRPVLEHRADATAAELMGGSIAVRLRADQTGGRLGMIENVLPPGFANLPLHIHPDFDEAFYVLEGELAFRVGREVITATPGTLVYAPGDEPHTFAELTGLQPVRFLLWVTPGGHETYFEALAAAAASSPTAYPSPERLADMMAEHAIEIVGGTDPTTSEIKEDRT
jgi:quercetin dioxygenase-like cupin family protein